MFFKQISSVIRYVWILLAAMPLYAQLRINTNSALPGATLNQSYNVALIGAAGTSPYTFARVFGTLPPNITLSSTGVLSGTPTAGGDFTFTVRITDSAYNQTTKQFTLKVTTQPLTAQPFPPPPTVPVGRLTGASVQGVGGTAPYKYSIITGTLPPGVNFTKTSCYCEAYAFIEGVPRTAGNYSVVVEVKDSAGRTATTPLTFNVVANPFALPAASIPPATRGAEYEFQLPFSGGFAPVSFSTDTDPLPPGLQLTAGGKIRGIVPVSATLGSYNFIASATDGAGVTQTRTYSMNVIAAAGDTIVTRSPLPTGVSGISYFKQLIVDNGSGPVTGNWNSFSGTLPAGLTFDQSSGTVTGTPTQTGTFTFTVQHGTASKTFTLTVSPTLFQWTLSSSLPAIKRGQYSLILGSFPTGMSGGTPASNVELVSGAWPAGMDISGNQYVAGTPTTAAFYGFAAEVTATDGQVANSSFFQQVLETPALQILTPGPNLPDAVLGVDYYFQDFGDANGQHDNGGGDSYTWTVLSGALPPGLTLYTDGELSGRPTSAGTYSFTLQVTDGYGATDQRAFELAVQPYAGSLSIDTSSPLPQGLYGQPYSTTLESTGVAPYTYTLDGGSLPAGFTLSQSGTISSNGPAIAGGYFLFTVRVQDSTPGSLGGPLSATRTYSLYIASNNPYPTLTSLSRTSIPSGSLGFPLTLTGSNFLPGAQVMWSGTPLATTFVNAGQLTAAVPSALLTGGEVYIYVQNPDGLSTNSLPFNVILPAPVLSSLSPNSVYSGSPAFTLQVVGRNFIAPIASDGPPYPASVIYFNGQPLNTVYDSPTQLHATVPASLVVSPGTVPVLVRNYDQQISNTLQFTIAGAPTLTKLTPGDTAAGSPQFTLVLEGTNFRPNVRVEWNGSPLTTYVDSSTSLRAIVDAGLLSNSGVYPVLVRTPEGLTSNTLNFTVTGNNPAITSLSPDTFPAGSPLSQLTVNGTGFQSDAVVYWNATALVTAFVSDTKLMAVVPANLLAAPGVARIQVRNVAAQTVSAARDLPVTGTGPAITSLAPNQAQTGSPQLTLTVNGINFLSGATVRFNNVDLATTFVSATQLTAVVPPTLLATSGDFAVIVRNPDSQLSPAATFTVSPNAVPPLITTLTPSTVAPGGPAFTLALQGSGFQSGAVVRWNGQDLTTIFVSATALTASVPQTLIASAGTAMILIHNPNGLDSNQVSLPITTTPPPVISVLNPDSAAAGSPQFALSVQGTGFQSGAIVRWNGQDLVTSFVSSTLLNATVSASLLVSPGSAQVVVRNPDQQTSAPASFTIPASLPPAITSLNPPAVNASTGPLTLVVNGTNFRNGASVLWNGAALVTAFVNNTQVTALVPAALTAFPGTATVQVRNPDNQTSTGVAILIRFPPPQLISMNPLAIVAGTPDLTLSVNALNVQNGAVLLWNGQPLQTAASGSPVSPAPVTLTVNVLPASLFAVPGNITIAVRNPDGQTSLPFTFQVIAPPPVITSLDPATVSSGSPTLQLRVSGAGFRNLSVVRWNGQPLPTAFFDANQLIATIDAGLLLSPGSASITVYNTDGAISNSITLPVSQSLTPEITALTPASAPVNGPAFTLGVAGRNFVPASQVLWNGTPLATTFGSAAQLSAAVASTLLAAPGAVTVTVRQPDGKTSTGALFAIGEALRITSGTPLPAAVKDSAYQFAFTASGGARPYQWRLASGSAKLPDGLTLAADGTLSGKPTVAATFPFTVEVVDATNTALTQDAALVVDSRDLGITSTSPLPPATAGTPYSFVMKSDARAALQLAWSVIEGALPAGLALNAETGEISGVPEEPAEPETATAAKASRGATVPVDFTFRIQVAAADRNPSRKQFALTVLPARGAFRIITPSPLPDATSNHPVHLRIAAAGGKAPYSFALQGTLPSGVTFNSFGELDGTPSAPGSFNFTITATDGLRQQASQDYQWRVVDGADGPTISSGPLLPISAAGRPVEVLVEAVQGKRPFSWSIISGTLPDGITFDPPTGRLTGTTASHGLFRFTVKVTDANGRVDQRVLALPVTATGEPLTMVTAALPPATLGVPYSLTLQAGGGKAPYEWSLAASSLPAGLSLSAGGISGTPTDPTSAAITLRLRDAFGFIVNRDFNLAVNIAPLPSARITGLPDSINPGQQPTLGLQLDSPYPVEITGRLDLTFAAIPDAPGVEPGLMFSTGGRTVSFRIPAGETAAVFPLMPLAFQAGSVSGTLTLHPAFLVAGTEVLPSNRPDRSVSIEPAPPVIGTVTLERRGGGFNIVVTGFSSTRELSEMVVTLTPATGRELLQTRYVVALADVFKKWYASPDSFSFGGQFQLTVPFDGDATAVQSASIRLRNSAGESAERRTN